MLFVCIIYKNNVILESSVFLFLVLFTLQTVKRIYVERQRSRHTCKNNAILGVLGAHSLPTGMMVGTKAQEWGKGKWETIFEIGKIGNKVSKGYWNYKFGNGKKYVPFRNSISDWLIECLAGT